MSTFTQILYQIVFSTKNRERTLTATIAQNCLNTYGESKKKQSHPYWINGVEDHLHIATHIHPSIALAPLIKDIKLATSTFISKDRIFEKFGGWQNGYAAFTYCYKEKDRLIEYIKNQENHHKTISFRDELVALLEEHGVEFEEKYLL